MVQRTTLGSLLKDPLRAAIFAALITLFAKWVDNRLQRRPDYINEYLKSMAYCAALVGFIMSVAFGKRNGSTTGYTGRTTPGVTGLGLGIRNPFQ